MNKENSHIVAGAVLVFLALCAIGGAWVALTDNAHASTGDNLSPTQRDWQRLNACAQYMPEYDGAIDEVIRCAAIGKGISRFESASGTSRVSKKQNNFYGIMGFKKSGRYLKTYKTSALCDLDYARIWWKYYRTMKINNLALAWTGEPHIAKKYASKVKEWYGIYEPMYRQMAESK